MTDADRTDRAAAAANVPMSGGPGMSASFGVAAPIGAVKAKDRLRAGRTALHREGPSRVALVTELPGTVSLQRRTTDGTWETLRRSRRWRRGRTVLDLSEAADGDVVRVVFAPRNGHIAAWVSGPIEH
jgi:hypothetical protein